MNDSTKTITQPTPSRQAGLRRLAEFLPQAGRLYASNRNSDLGPQDRGHVSLLSGHLRHRLVLETEVLDAVLSRFAPTTAEKFIQEVFWRGYFKGWLEHHPSVWASYRRDVTRLVSELEINTDLATRYEQAVSAQTGIACFDDWSEELCQVGYLHNHTRMWFASIWIFTLQLPWQLGADFFLRHLIDGDPASNTLSWRWVGGLHTKGKTYLARPSNIEKYTNGRYNPEGQLTPSAPPLFEEAQHHRQPLREVSTTDVTNGVGLLITEEDCFAETLYEAITPKACIGLLATGARSPMPVGSTASTFARQAVEDALTRASDHFGCPLKVPDEDEDWVGVLRRFAQEHRINTIVTAYAPIGPVSEKLAQVRGHLADDGITLCEVKRDYDGLTWPHATRGFFALKKIIPGILEQLQRSQTPRLL